MIYFDLFFTFFKIGLFTFGGGYAMIPLIQSEMLSKGWMDAASLVDFIAVSEATPGPFAVNISTYIGSETAGLLGAACATFGVVLPSFLIILIVAKCFVKFQQSQIVMGAMRGLRPAVIGLIAAAFFSVGQTVFLPTGELSSLLSIDAFIGLVIFGGALFLLLKKRSHPILIIVLSAASGILFCSLRDLFR